MPFLLRGRDSRTGAPVEPLYSQALTEQEALADANALHIIVDTLEQRETDPMSPCARGGPEYEFGAAENRIIGGLAAAMSLCGLAAGVFGIVELLASIVQRPAPIIPGLLGVIIGSLMIYAASPFHRIVRTTGHDVSNLIEALARLRFIFQIQVVLAMLAIVAAIAVLALRT
jgi:hypothetical protein